MSRLIIVSNRLPITVRPGAAVEVEPSSGGLVSALAGLADSGEYEGLVWIGWPGSFVPSEAEERRLTALIQEDASMKISMVPVWLSKADVEDFYNGYANSSLWPLLHWMTPYARFKKAWAESYRRVNELFADTVLSTAKSNDIVWVQDFHLFLVPQMLRRKREASAALPKEQLAHAWSGIRPKDLPPEQEEDTYEDAYDETPHSQKAKRPADLPSPSGHTRFNSFDDTLPEPNPQAEESPAAGAGEEQAETDHFTRTSGVYHRHSVKMNTEQDAKLRIAFFLHVPFPSYEVICSLPQCADIIEGMLGADLVGFHTYSYLRHFRSCIVRLCGFAPEIDHVEHRGQRTKLGVFPIGANCSLIAKAMRSPRFAEHLANYTTQFEGRSLVLSVERLDYSKGMPQKLGAIERYLELVAEREAERVKARKEDDRPRRDDAEDEEDDESRATPSASSPTAVEEPAPGAGRGLQGRLEDLQKRFEGRKAARDGDSRWRFGASFKRMVMAAGRAFGNERAKQLDHGRTVFLFVAVPSRQEVDQYKAIELEVHRRISDINGRFSTPHYQPIVYIHRSVPMEELTALYARADCCMVTPLVDGMNLVAKEFLVAKDRSKEQVVPGTIVLSELAGAAQELFDAIVVNPYDEDAVAEAIALGLELTRGGYLDEDLRWEVTEKMREACLANDSSAWARAFLGELQDAAAEPSREAGGTQPQAWRDGSMQMLKDSVASLFFESNPGAKALFLDYDGTLREFEPNAEDAVPSDDARQLFRNLADREDLRVFIMSGRSKEFLEEHFGSCLPFTLIAEHGHYERGPSTGHEWRMFNPYTCTDWITKVKPIMDLFTRCTPGSSIEMKDSAILWHYEECDDEYGQFKAKELMHQLALSLGNLPCQICQGPNVVEVCSLRIKKGLIVNSICLERERAGSPFAEVLCVGDDETDESMFTEAPEGAWTVKVGAGETRARHRLCGPAEVRRFLRFVAEQCLPGGSQTPFTRRSFARGDSVDMDRYRSCQEDPRSSVGIARSVSEIEGDPLAGLPETETLDEVPSSS